MLLESFSNKNFLVIGDIMLDTYVFGTINRISPEAPVPVVQTSNVQNKLGGAANVALNLASLGASVMLAGVLGNDDEGKQIEDLLKDNNIETGIHYPISSKKIPKQKRNKNWKKQFSKTKICFIFKI